jgi:hypothetical protein
MSSALFLCAAWAQTQSHRDLIRQLGDDDYAVRELAEEKPVRLGHGVERPLRQALVESKDLKVRHRIERILATSQDHAGTNRLVYHVEGASAETQWRIADHDGRNAGPLVPGDVVEGFPAYHRSLPDRPRAYHSDAESPGQNQIYIREPGTDPGSLGKRVTHDRHNNTLPWLSPAGDRVVYFSTTEKGEQRLCVLALAEGEEPRVLLKRAEGLPSWSECSKRIAYLDSEGVLCIMEVGTAKVERVRARGWKNERNADLVWSPDGSHVAAQLTSTREVFVFTINRSTCTRLGAAAERGMAWTPDSKRLTVAATGEGGSVPGPKGDRHQGETDLYNVSVDGKTWKNLTQTPTISEAMPQWVRVRE